MIEYQAATEELLVFLIDHDPHKALEPVVRVPLRIQNFVKTDNGAAYLGFCQETHNITNVCLIENWSFDSSVKTNQNDAWGGLSLDYTCEWPKHLILSTDTIEKYNSLFRFLFPIKRVQIELQNVWSQKVRSMKHLSQEPVFKLAMQLR